ncbi:hypothetical protein K1719_002482 [Acacia pycnantha]|nr:hypothetical protein K1719_002482 [Acacia pycnantha]
MTTPLAVARIKRDLIGVRLKLFFSINIKYRPWLLSWDKDGICLGAVGIRTEVFTISIKSRRIYPRFGKQSVIIKSVFVRSHGGNHDKFYYQYGVTSIYLISAIFCGTYRVDYASSLHMFDYTSINLALLYGGGIGLVSNYHLSHFRTLESSNIGAISDCQQTVVFHGWLED